MQLPSSLIAIIMLLEKVCKALVSMFIFTLPLVVILVVVNIPITYIKKKNKNTNEEAVTILRLCSVIGVALGYFIGMSKTPLLSSIIGLLIPVFVGLFQGYMKNKDERLQINLLEGFMTQAILLLSMLLSTVYTVQLYAPQK